VHSVKRLGALGRQLKQLAGSDSQPGAFEAAQNFTDQIAPHRVGFDYRKSSFHTHYFPKASCIVRPMVAGDDAM
jgi:hypothetical protein